MRIKVRLSVTEFSKPLNEILLSWNEWIKTSCLQPRAQKAFDKACDRNCFPSFPWPFKNRTIELLSFSFSKKAWRAIPIPLGQSNNKKTDGWGHFVFLLREKLFASYFLWLLLKAFEAQFLKYEFCMKTKWTVNDACINAIYMLFYMHLDVKVGIWL